MPPIEVLSVNRIGQISGTTGPTWLRLVDAVGNPLLTNTGPWNVVGVDEGANVEHTDCRLTLARAICLSKWQPLPMIFERLQSTPK
jgi:hypothetical protein